MTYQQTLDYLFSKLPMYQRQGVAAYKSDIGNIVAASKFLNNPHKRFKSIHIAGTNGKGSTAHMLSSVLQEAGYKTGLYTSPHLKDFRERIKINGKMIAQQKVIDFVSNNKNLFEDLEMSFFEMTVAMAFDYFAKQQVDIAIIECGLGGRLDSTNIIDPELAIITNIGLDHTNLLGETLGEIAVEKAGIIKENRPIIIGKKQKETKNIFEKIAKEKHASLYFVKQQLYVETDLKGAYQKENCATALKAIELLRKLDWKISTQHIQKGLNNTVRNTGLLGRWQILNKKPLTICDTAHNEDGIKQVIQQIKQIQHQNLHYVFGALNDKSISNILRLLPQKATYYFCKANIPRAMDALLLQKQAKAVGLEGIIFSSVKKALADAKKQAKTADLILVGGSSFVVAEVL